MKYTAVIAIIFFSTIGFIHAEETYNLDIVFKRTSWSLDTILCYGYSLSTAGDLNQDGFDDFIYLVFYDSWDVRGYIFYGGNPMDTLYDVVLHGETGELGEVCSGDINGDSVNDIIIGQPSGSGGYGVVQIYYGGSTMDSLPDLKIHGEVMAGEFGCSVACGDINGDGCGDIIVGAYAYNGFTLDGRVYVYYGGALFDSLPDIILDGQNSESMGGKVGSGGDLNSDGFEDIVIGARSNHEVAWGAGKIYVFFGGNPMNTWPDCWLHGEGFNHYLGWFGCDIMRVENDHDMLITGTSEYPNGWPGHNSGKVYILKGGNPMDTLPDLWMIGDSDTCSLGRRSKSAGDVNNDGFDDAVVGAPHGHNFLGTGYVWLGGMSMDTIPDAYLRGDINNQEIGWEVASAGDIDGDGCDEVLFSNYAVTGMPSAVWACRYTGPAVQEQGSQTITPFIQINPNPFSRTLFIRYNDLSNHENIEVHMYDITGREVFSQVKSTKVEGKIIQIDQASLPVGVYFVDVTAGSHCVVEKVIKIE